MRATGANVGYEAVHLIVSEPGCPDDDDTAAAA
jgi:hypothetical protein